MNRSRCKSDLENAEYYISVNIYLLNKMPYLICMRGGTPYIIEPQHDYQLSTGSYVWEHGTFLLQ